MNTPNTQTPEPVSSGTTLGSGFKTVMTATALSTLAACGGGGSTSGAPEVVVVPPGTLTVTRTAQAGTQMNLADIVGSNKVTDLIGLPTGVTWNSTTNTLTIPATVTGNVANNPYRITFTATDAAGKVTKVTLNADIDNAPTLTSPFSLVSTLEGAPVTIDVLSHFADSNSDQLVILEASSAQGTVTVLGGSVSFTRKAGFLGDATVEVTVSDGRGGTIAKSIPVKVKEAAVDSPSRFNLNVGNISETGAIVACSVFDDEEATGTCTLKTADGGVILTWPAGENKVLSNLTPGTNYAVYLDGTAGEKQPDGSIINKPFPTKIEGFRTNVRTPPPTYCELHPEDPICI